MAQDPIHRIHDLRSSLNRELSSLAERFDEELETYRKVQFAVQEKREELKSVYDIEAAASDLAALIPAQQTKKEKFDQEMEHQKSELDQEMTESTEFEGLSKYVNSFPSRLEAWVKAAVGEATLRRTSDFGKNEALLSQG
ncbi:MAG: hypothetical protein SV775_13040 [Thermodesulfobacteriota bacterium]|nr:hypothetical protein [Thermodesulfobacteriota bacterium]